jgi:bacterial leucyl aminopeptidase
VSQFSHSFVESSIIAKIAGASDGPVTILGGHMDSINLRNPSTGRAPGADDDGSGTVNLIEAFRALAAAGFQPPTPIEFQWYAGEEGGLLGSADISTQYASDGVEVKGMMQLDMTA